MGMWRNWQTRSTQTAFPNGVEVQVLSSLPITVSDRLEDFEPQELSITYRGQVKL